MGFASTVMVGHIMHGQKGTKYQPLVGVYIWVPFAKRSTWESNLARLAYISNQKDDLHVLESISHTFCEEALHADAARGPGKRFQKEIIRTTERMVSFSYYVLLGPTSTTRVKVLRYLRRNNVRMSI